MTDSMIYNARTQSTRGKSGSHRHISQTVPAASVMTVSGAPTLSSGSQLFDSGLQATAQTGLAGTTFPVSVAVLRYDAWEIGVVSALALLVIARHLGNIRRLLRRQEIDLDARPS